MPPELQTQPSFGRLGSLATVAASISHAKGPSDAAAPTPAPAALVPGSFSMVQGPPPMDADGQVSLPTVLPHHPNMFLGPGAVSRPYDGSECMATSEAAAPIPPLMGGHAVALPQSIDPHGAGLSPPGYSIPMVGPIADSVAAPMAGQMVSSPYFGSMGPGVTPHGNAQNQLAPGVAALPTPVFAGHTADFPMEVRGRFLHILDHTVHRIDHRPQAHRVRLGNPSPRGA